MPQTLVDGDIAFMALVLDALPAHIAVVDLDGRIISVNEAWLQFARDNDSEDMDSVSVGANYLDVCRRAADEHEPLSREALEGIQRVLENAKEAFFLEYPCHAPTRKAWFVMEVRPVADLECVVISHTNVTAQKEAEEDVRALIDDLARSNVDLEKFAYIASHDLEEPLRQIVGFTELLDKRYGRLLDENAQEYMGFIIDGGNRMQALIHDLLIYSRVGRGDKERPATDLNQVLNAALFDLRGSIADSGASITSDPMPTLEINATNFRHVFQNLIMNAIMFRGDKKPEIHISAERRDNEWLFRVSDNGIGFQSDAAGAIFSPFQRQRVRGKYMGTGMGLAICKHVVQSRGGRIWAESKPGEGARFFFTIPIR